MPPEDSSKQVTYDAQWEQSLAEVERSLTEIKQRYAQIKRDHASHTELQQRQQQLQTELQQVKTELETLELNLESRLFSWSSLREPFWQAVRFGGLGVVVGWILNACAG